MELCFRRCLNCGLTKVGLGYCRWKLETELAYFTSLWPNLASVRRTAATVYINRATCHWKPDCVVDNGDYLKNMLLSADASGKQSPIVISGEYSTPQQTASGFLIRAHVAGWIEHSWCEGDNDQLILLIWEASAKFCFFRGPMCDM